MTEIKDLVIEYYPLEKGQVVAGRHYFAFQVDAFLNSDLVRTASKADCREDAFCAILLRVETFRQDPPGTLPADDDELRHLWRFPDGADAWAARRAFILSEFGTCRVRTGDDLFEDRLFHPLMRDHALFLYNQEQSRVSDANQRSKRKRVRAKMRELKCRSPLIQSQQVVDELVEEVTERNETITQSSIRRALQARGYIEGDVVPMDRHSNGRRT